METDYYKVLDDVLDYLNEDNKDKLGVGETLNISSLKNLTPEEQFGAFKMLQDEGYIKERTLTFKGRIFIQNGKYKTKRRRDAISRGLLTTQTWLIAGGAVGLLIFEWLKYCRQ